AATPPPSLGRPEFVKRRPLKGGDDLGRERGSEGVELGTEGRHFFGADPNAGCDGGPESRRAPRQAGASCVTARDFLGSARDQVARCGGLRAACPAIEVTLPCTTRPPARENEA